MTKIIKHFILITRHRLKVMKYCFKMKLYWQGIVHDLSKYSLTEFISSVKYYNGKRSPIDNEKDDKGYSLAWQHHKGRNPHHWEYWIDNLGTYENKPCRIPRKYVLEMICDWIAAGQTYEKRDWTPEKMLNYFEKYRKERIFHPETLDFIDDILYDMFEYGVDFTIKHLECFEY